MGIKKLRKNLSSKWREIHLSEISHSFVAVDAYGWLYKGLIEAVNKNKVGEDM